MKATTEEILDSIDTRVMTEEAREVYRNHSTGPGAYLEGYRTAEAKWMESMQEVVGVLAEARDDVQECLNRAMYVVGSTKKSEIVDCYIAQLARIDAMIAKYKEVRNEGND